MTNPMTNIVSEVVLGIPGPPGPPGEKGANGDVSSLSADPGNAITVGTDGGLYAPDDIPTDPLAYYILARS